MVRGGALVAILNDEFDCGIGTCSAVGVTGDGEGAVPLAVVEGLII